MSHNWPQNNRPRFLPDPHLRVRGFERPIQAADLEGESGSGGDLLDSLSEQGQTQLTGDITLSEGSNVTLTQTGQDIEIAATGGSVDSTYGELYYHPDTPCALPVAIPLGPMTACEWVTVAPLTVGESNDMVPVALTGTIPILVDGWYMVQFGITMAGETADNNKLAAVYVNEQLSTIRARKSQTAVGADYFMSLKAKGILELAAGQNLTLRITQNTEVAEAINVYLVQFTALQLLAT